MRPYDADSILWNWARWCGTGPTVGNMAPHYADDDNSERVDIRQAEEVDRLHKTLPHPEQMIVIAEYPQRNGRFEGLTAQQRREAAQRWVKSVTGVWVREVEYRLYVGLFKDLVWRELG